MSAPNSEDKTTFIHGGVTTTTLGQIFGLEHRDVVKRLAGRVDPMPTEGRYMHYRIRDAAPYLCEMKIDPEDLIKSLSPSKLPPALQDAFWKAQLSRQKYQKERGELWNTARVFEVISKAFKVLRLTILMFVDTVEERTQLSDEQRRIVQELGDGLLAALETSIREEFKGYVAADDEHGVPVKARSTPVAEVDPFD